ncbi:hypothetical protein HYPSUDRAFT_60444 [Hypholoma sublateritium FD-334 SS-4]|uniref:Uncharacterized protein n=1 Tax=Hypholoma sublateritium (strain FD-334 SS-4) TaxID=945553 RepID=A0A0D2LND7_HYPSF|nr:hypothetical protein HYPSUDRAFT_60444 [Hypholoma sublateritium FD-334 SS-4]
MSYQMPPRFSRIYHIQVKAYKLTIMLSGVEPGTLISELKSDTLSAIKSDVAQGSLDIMNMDPPEIDVETEEDFELCRAVKERGKTTGKYEVLPSSKAVRDHGLAGWETLYLQFRDRSTGELKPITYTRPQLFDEEENAPAIRPVETPSTVNKGKRKADDIDEGISVDEEMDPI